MSGWPTLPNGEYPTLTKLFALKYTSCLWGWDISTGRRQDVLFSLYNLFTNSFNRCLFSTN